MKTAKTALLKNSNLIFTFDRYAVYLKKTDLKLSPVEKKIFSLLFNNQDKYLSSSEIHKIIYTRELETGKYSSTISSHILNLKNKIKKVNNQVKYIESNYYGYKLINI
jgi:DNA-binding response OmpR family regulator